MKKTPPIILNEEDSPQTDIITDAFRFAGLPPRQMPEQNTLRFDSPVVSHGFTQIPNVVLRDLGLSSNEKITYALLLSYAWQRGACYPGHERLQYDLGCERKTLIRCLSRLQLAKLVRIERRGQGKTNIYHIRRLSDRYKSIVDKGAGG